MRSQLLATRFQSERVQAQSGRALLGGFAECSVASAQLPPPLSILIKPLPVSTYKISIFSFFFGFLGKFGKKKCFKSKLLKSRRHRQTKERSGVRQLSKETEKSPAVCFPTLFQQQNDAAHSRVIIIRSSNTLRIMLKTQSGNRP